MSDENTILLIIFLFLILMYFVGVVFLQRLLHKKYKFPTQIPPPFSETEDFSVFLEGKTASNELFHRRPGYLNSELVPQLKNENSTLIDKNISDRTELLLDTEENSGHEVKHFHNINQSISEKEVKIQLAEKQVTISKDIHCEKVLALSKDSKEFLPKVPRFKETTQVVFEKEECLKQEIIRATEKLNQTHRNMTVPEVIEELDQTHRNMTVPEVIEELDQTHRNMTVPEVIEELDQTHRNMTVPEVIEELDQTHRNMTVPEVIEELDQTHRNMIVPEVIEELDQTHRNMTVPEVIEELDQKHRKPVVSQVVSKCFSRSEYVDSCNRQETADFSKKHENIQDICDVHSKPLTKKEHSKRNPKKVKRRKKNKVVKGQEIFKKWQKEKPDGVVDTHPKQLSSLYNDVRLSASDEILMERNDTQIQTVLKGNENTLNYSKQTESEEQQKQKGVPVIKASCTNNERHSLQEDTKDYFQNFRLESFSHLVNKEHETLPLEEKIEIVENAHWKCLPMLSMDSEEFAQGQQITEYNEVSKKTEREKSQNSESNQLEYNQLLLTTREDFYQNPQILDSQNIESRDICQFSVIKNKLKISENDQHEKSENFTVDNASCFNIEKRIQDNDNFAERNSQQPYDSKTNLEHQSPINSELVEILKSVDDNKNEKLKSGSTDTAQYSRQNLFSETNSSHKVVFQFFNKETENSVYSSSQNIFVPESSNRSYIDLETNMEPKYTDVQGENPDLRDNIKSFHQISSSGIYQQQDDNCLTLNCTPVEKPTISTLSYQNNLSANILVSKDFNQYSLDANSNESNILKYCQNLQACVSSVDDATPLYKNVFPKKDFVQETDNFSSKINKSKNREQPKQTRLPSTDHDSKQIRNSKLEKEVENIKTDPDYEKHFEQLSPESFSGIIPQDLTTDLITFQSPTCPSNIQVSPESQFYVNVISEEFHQKSINNVDQKSKPFGNLQDKTFQSNDQTIFSETSPRQEFESSTDIRSHSPDHLRSTQNPQLVKYITRSVTHVTLFAEDDDVSEKNKKENNRNLAEDEKVIDNSKVPSDFSSLKQVKKPNSVSLTQQTPQAPVTNDTNSSQEQMKGQSKSCNDLTNFEEVSKISQNEATVIEEITPQVHTTQMSNNSNKYTSYNVQPSERIPTIKQVHWVPGYVLPPPKLSDPISKEPDDSSTKKSDNDSPRHGILKPAYSSHQYEDLSNSTAFEESASQYWILPKPQDPRDRDVSFWYFSQYGHPQYRSIYWSNNYRDPMYTWNINYPRPKHIYSLQNDSFSSSAWDRYSKNNRYLAPDRFLEIPGYEIPSLGSGKLGSSYKNANQDNGQQRKNSPTCQCLDSEFSQPIIGSEDDESQELQRHSKEFWDKSPLFHQDRYFSPVKDLAGSDHHQPLQRYEYFKWLDTLSRPKPRYPRYPYGQYDSCSYGGYREYLADLWYREKYWHDHAMRAYRERCMDFWSEPGYQDWYSERYWENHSRYLERYRYDRSVCRDLDKYRNNLDGYGEKSLHEYSTPEYEKQYLHDSLPNRNEERNCDKQSMSRYTKSYDTVKPISKTRDSSFYYGPTIGYKETDERIRFRERERADQFRQKEKYGEEWPVYDYRPRRRGAFIVPRHRRIYKEDRFATDPKELVNKDRNLEELYAYQKEYWDRERYWNDRYRERYRERYRCEWPSSRK